MAARRPRTVADEKGVKVGRLRRLTLHRLVQARSALAEISLAWSEIDSAVEFDAEELIDALDRFQAGELDMALKLLAEPAE